MNDPRHVNEDREQLRRLAQRLEGLVTEARHPAVPRLDACTTLELVEWMNREDRSVAEGVAAVLPEVARGVDLIVASLSDGGRLFYLGAGTSGRLGVLDASECPPTFGTDPERVTGVIAGGPPALLRSAEGIEDDPEQGGRDLEEAGARAGDVVVGITASTRTPYVIGGLDRARRLGLRTIYLICNPAGAQEVEADVVIAPVLGAEIVAGSTRLKAGTATKMILNMLTTATFVRLGKTWGNLMVDIRPTSDKLRARARRMVMLTCRVSFDEADQVLRQAGEEVKTAVVMLRAGVDTEQARRRLAQHDARVRDTLGGADPIEPERANDE